MPVYLLIDIDLVEDKDLYAEYTVKVLPLVERHGGQYLVRGGDVYPVTGGWQPERLVVVQFETIALANEFLTCPEYLELIPLRERAISSRSIIAEGYISA